MLSQIEWDEFFKKKRAVSALEGWVIALSYIIYLVLAWAGIGKPMFSFKQVIKSCGLESCPSVFLWCLP